MEEFSDEDYTYEDQDDDYGESSQDDWRDDQIPMKSSNSNCSMLDGGYRKQEEVKILGENDLKKLMTQVVSEISSVMNLPTDASTALLRFFNWNIEKLYDQFYADPESMISKVGIENSEIGLSTKTVQVNKRGKSCKIYCKICCEDVMDTLALPCNHYFCLECWKKYLKNALSLGPSCVYTTCPQYKCPQIVTENLFEMNLSKTEMKRYHDFSLRSFVDTNKSLRFCPGIGCEKIIKAPRSCLHVRCTCGHVFCFRCTDEAHEPVSCEDLQRWHEKCTNESETANWILANTKKCPKCETRIEKNQGCNHMTCRQCKAEFCWICSGIWSDHGNNTGGFYKCNRFTGEVTEGMSDVAIAKAELERYLHYFKRYQNHANAQKFAQTQMDMRTEKHMMHVLETQGAGWIDVQFLRVASEQLVECRRALKYTYVYGYFLSDPIYKRQKDLLEHHQEDLEKFTEHLSHLTERPFEMINRAEVINYTRVTNNFLVRLLESVKDGLAPL
mmetsp:Transcript_15975/g.23702  ORF Transcript_15975/g.23702 Transcript_15975/m.23702 type:complete len:501 (-) Transcript_15975:6-1508(-)|eukprot:CAMPEP_0171474986 /NCGR_PEP_ID=MMETSP0946-20130122/2743_1 /TAXON_ID=109269 /ORGANISM="Vaucheria litorea, Strain CCMP2940" /LENGTH=500 /DNA_ID=CAMNT_0012005005 /DNA_START=63 /DNA_END=1565 /DNA_ORIENTATION=-